MGTVVTDVLQAATGDDAYNKFDATGFNNSAAYVALRSYTTAASQYRYGSGFQFVIPSSVVVADVTKVELMLTGYTGGGGNMAAQVIVEPTTTPAAWADNSTNRPHARCNNVSTGWVNWGSSGSPITVTADVAVPTPPDLLTSFLVVAEDANWVSNGRKIAVLIQGVTNYNSGQTLVNSQSASTGKPYLRITETKADVDQSFTVSAPVAQAVADHATPWVEVNDVDYDDGYGSDTRRVLDLAVPPGSPPSGGWPLVVFTHGGGYESGDEEGDRPDMKEAIILRGCVYASIRYKLADATTTSNTGGQHPQAVQDVLCAVGHLIANNSVNPDKVIYTGYSAGAHLALETAVVANDTATHAWTYTDTAHRPVSDAYNTGNNFTFHQGSAQRLAIGKPLGVFVFGPPVNMTEVYSDTWDATKSSLRNYNGGRELPSAGVAPNNYSPAYSSGSPAAYANGEMNIDDIVRGGAAGANAGLSIWEGKRHIPDFPMGMFEGYDDWTLGVTGSTTALKAALDTLNIPANTKPAHGGGTYTLTGSLNTSGGMSWWLYHHLIANDDHAYVLANGQATFRSWLDTVKYTSGYTTVMYIPANVEAPVAGAIAGTPIVTVTNYAVIAVVAATTTIPAPTVTIEAQGGSVAPDAVAAVSTVPAPGVAGGGLVAPSVVVATTVVTASPGYGGWRAVITGADDVAITLADGTNTFSLLTGTCTYDTDVIISTVSAVSVLHGQIAATDTSTYGNTYGVTY